jgi:subtilisin family serine protease
MPIRLVSTYLMLKGALSVATWLVPKGLRSVSIARDHPRRCAPVFPNSTFGSVWRRVRNRQVRPVVALTGVLALAVATLPNSASAASQPTPPPGWKITPLTGSVVNGAKSQSGRLAKSDAGLLALRSSKPVNVVVKLDYDALAGYRGELSGLPATSPAATHRAFNPKSDAVQRYERYVSGIESKFLSALRSRIPQAKTGKALRMVYGGVPLTLPGNKAAELLKLPGVTAVQENRLERLLTDSSPEFIGAPTIYNQLGGANSSGKGVIVGVLDSGGWPEHPQYADPGDLPAPPPTADDAPRTCDFGDNPTTPANDPFACNRKLISGQPFLTTYNAVFGDEFYPDSARDSDGHGTHTSTTSAGGPASNANPLGIDRGAIHGIAPAAHVAVYKVCGTQGCFPSDTVQAVERAILDRVRVINFSISGGEDPYSDPVELAFLDAYEAGVFVSASAGNDGPGAGTVNHNSPWVTTVAASTQRRAFRSTVTLTGGGATATVTGASITQGISTPAPVVLASAAPYSDPLCLTTPPAGLFNGKIVACERGPNRVLKSFNVRAGGGVGMLMYNTTENSNLSDLMTDNHWLPSVLLDKPNADTLLAFVAAHPDVAASFTQGAKTTAQGDVITGFSSRGPGGDFLKPDVTAPGLSILAGGSPATNPQLPVLGPPGNQFMAIAGTSMSSPHVAGSAALLFALHPDWTPGQVKSALETTGKTAGVVKTDRTTPADPFDFGGGRVDLTKAGDPGLTFDETAANYAAGAALPAADRIDLNVPSVNAPTMPGAISTTRVAKNVTDRTLEYQVSATAPNGAQITVVPSSFSVKPGKTVKLAIAITGAGLANGQYFGEIRLDQQGGSRDLHLPVAFNRTQGGVTLAQACEPAEIAVNTGRSTCSVTAQNNTLERTKVTAASHLDSNLSLTSVTGARRVGSRDAVASGNLAARGPERPNIAPGASPAGYIPLDAFGVDPFPVGDEDAVNINLPANGLPPFVFAGKTYDTIGLVSNGYSVAGGAAGVDIRFEPQTLPDPVRPNAELASFWTDLDGTDAPGIFATVLSDNTTGDDWLVVEWRLNVFGTTSQRVFQQWIGLNGSEDISFTYDPNNLPAAPPAGFGLTVGVENDTGTAGNQIDGLPTTDLRVTTTPGTPGGSLTYSFQLSGIRTGAGAVTTVMSTPAVRGVTSEVDRITVR